MAIEFEQPRVSLINANSLPTASANVRVPDFGAGLSKLGKTLAANEKEKIAEEEMNNAEAAASTFVGIDENGAFQAWPERTFQTKAARDAYDRSVEMVYRSQFEAALSTQFNEIQGTPTQTTEQRSQRMQAALDARMAAIQAVAPRLVPTLRARGIELISARSYNMAQVEKAQADKLRVDGLKTVIEREAAIGADAAANGLNPQVNIDNVTAAVRELQTLKIISDPAAAEMIRSAGESMNTSAVIKTVTDRLFDGTIDPLAVDNFATGIENGTSFELKVERPPSDNDFRQPSPIFKMTSDDVRAKITDPKLRGLISQQIKEASRERRQFLADVSKHIDFRNHLAMLDSIQGHTRAIDSEYHNDLDLLSSKIMTEQGFDNPNTQRTLRGLMQTTKRMPAPVAQSLLTMINSGDEKQIEKALNFYHVATTMTNKWGDQVGNQIAMSIPEEINDVLSTMARGVQLGYNTRELMDSYRELRKPGANISLDDQITIFNNATGKKFYSEVTRTLSDAFGSTIPPQAMSDFRLSFRLSMGILGDPQQAFDHAAQLVVPRYAKSDIFLNGVAKADMRALTNPIGFTPRQRTIFGTPSPGTEYDWLEDHLGDFLQAPERNIVFDDDFKFTDLQSVLQGEQTVTPTEMGGATLPTSQYLGKRVFLKPTATNVQKPDFMVQVKLPDGRIETLMTTGPDGVPQPLLYRPYAAHKLATEKLFIERKKQTLEQDAPGATMELRQRILSATGIGDLEIIEKSVDDAAFDEWLSLQPESIQKRYNLQLDQIKEGVKNNIRRLEQEPNAPKDQQGSLQTNGTYDFATLMEPQGAGQDIARSAVAMVEKVVPDGTGGTFMLRVAAQESSFGEAAGTFRATGDKGIWQVNTSSGFQEVKRQIASGTGPIFDAAQKIKATYGVDLAAATPLDMDKPFVSAAFARLYFLTASPQAPQGLTEQAAYWKRYYNTNVGAGRPDQFIANASRVNNAATPAPDAAAAPASDMATVEDDDIIISPAGLGYQLRLNNNVKPVAMKTRGGVIVASATGQPDPVNFRALDNDVQESAKAIAADFGQPLRITPQGGKQPDKRNSTSQHKHGRALDVFIGDYSDEEKIQLITAAIANGATAIGGYGEGTTGNNTLHIDFRTTKGAQPDGMAIWWRKQSGKDLPPDEGPFWFREGLRRGRAKRDERKNGVRA